MDDLIGKIVYSKSGRDKGRMFVVVQVVNEQYLVIADGDMRKIGNPKVKNIKHLHFTNTIAEDVVSCIKSGELPENHIIRKNLKKMQGTRETDGKEVW